MTATLPEIITAHADPDNRTESFAGTGGPDSGARRGASLAERGYVHGRFGGVPVLVGPELASQLKSIRQQLRQP